MRCKGMFSQKERGSLLCSKRGRSEYTLSVPPSHVSSYPFSSSAICPVYLFCRKVMTEPNKIHKRKQKTKRNLWKRAKHVCLWNFGSEASKVGVAKSGRGQKWAESGSFSKAKFFEIRHIENVLRSISTVIAALKLIFFDIIHFATFSFLVAQHGHS